LLSNETGARVIRFTPREGGSRVNRGAERFIGNADPDPSPVPDLGRYQGRESSDEYRHRMPLVNWMRTPQSSGFNPSLSPLADKLPRRSLPKPSVKSRSCCSNFQVKSNILLAQHVPRNLGSRCHVLAKLRDCSMQVKTHAQRGRLEVHHNESKQGNT
jgi:hypothetical protein